MRNRDSTRKIPVFVLALIWLTGIRAFAQNDPPYPSAPSAPENIVYAEYFIDEDPGFGAGDEIVISPGVDISNVAIAVNTGMLSGGIHRLFIRSLSAEGRWSITASQEFLVDYDPPYPSVLPALDNIVYAEYFIDEDPGFGAGEEIVLSPDVDISNVGISVNTGMLSGGIHRLLLRSLSAEGRWSITASQEFLVDYDPPYPSVLPALGNIIYAEYFIAEDPGFGAGEEIVLSPGVDISNVAVSVITDTLNVGIHRLFLRSLSAEGRWSIVAHKEFQTSEVFVCPVPLTVCPSDDPFEFTGAFPDGGEYSGNGVINDFFHPLAAGKGQHTIIYDYIDPVEGWHQCAFEMTVRSGIVVLPGDDGGIGTLREVIICMAEGDTIVFHASLAGDTIFLSEEITVDKNITIDGLGVDQLFISGAGDTRIIHLPEGIVLTLKNLKLLDGYSMDQGGALFIEGHLILENVVFENNLEDDAPKAFTVVPGATVEIKGVVEMRDE